MGVVIFIGWVGAWFFMSGAPEKLSAWSSHKLVAYTANKGFTVQNILVEGRHYTDADVIQAIVGVEKRAPLFSFDPDAAQATIEKITWVKSAQVERRLPDTIYIKLQERVPMALWQRHNRLSLIDTEGVVLSDKNLENFRDYIIVVGEKAPNAAPDFLKLLMAEPVIVKHVEAISYISERRWDLKLKSGAIVKLPEKDLPLAMRRLAVMQEDQNLMDKDIQVIDVRDQTRITVRTKPGAVQEYRANYKNLSVQGNPI